MLASSATDFACGLVAGITALFIRFDGVNQPSVIPYVVTSIALPFLWSLALVVMGTYDQRFIGIGSDEYRRVANAGFILTAAVAIVAYATKTDIARGYVIMAIPLATALSLVCRFLLRKRLHRRRIAGHDLRNVVVVGHASAVADLVGTFNRERHHGLDVVAVCIPDASAAGATSEVLGIPVLGDFSDVPFVVDQVDAEVVAVLACPEMDGTALRRLAWELEKSDTDLIVAPALMEVAGPRTSIRPIAGLPLLHVEHPELEGARQVIKGVYDRLVAAFALILLSPVFAIISTMIRAGSPGPAFFRQTRVGKDGAIFDVYKFRTMVVDAEQQKVKLLELNESDGALFKIKKDPRITSIGSWLRRWSVDELPQLINVLKGEMSLVGPRPPLPEEVARYGHDVRRRLVVKPGLTGLWQVSGRSDLSWEESVRLDLRYVENWSLSLDLQILWKTWQAVFYGRGAY
ncbi:sugar transferase [Rhizohabitans arisaemae]|uniref:sugar transferase n=1 Tax=Rhizohabitans arisaemae TaxID=2720610 RepID=UPI0024B0D7D7|nr:sugar transferase [Rhizohabitans arisaemae]